MRRFIISCVVSVLSIGTVIGGSFLVNSLRNESKEDSSYGTAPGSVFVSGQDEEYDQEEVSSEEIVWKVVIPEKMSQEDLGEESSDELGSEEVGEVSLDEGNQDVVELDETIPEHISQDVLDQEEADLEEVEQGFEVVNSNTEDLGIKEEFIDGEFYFAYFDVLTEDVRKVAIPSVILRYHGTMDSFNPEDLSDFVLTRDGEVIANVATYQGRFEQSEWRYENITDFYFEFDSVNTEVGNYGFQGTYQGKAFKVTNKILEAPINDSSANKDDFTNASWCYYTDPKDQPKALSELVFCFDGLQHTFYLEDVTDLKIFKDGVEIPYSIQDYVFRYHESFYEDMIETSYQVLLEDQICDPGSYYFTGKYQGLEFRSCELNIP